ncbi:hypothetical protein AMECASPLE_028607 [Ameca splendens]|uniref:Uncharacterized protein n=1 Tax=Ameca splendens TaxID=208324 RepID=A0ABV0XII2_9TELE
MDAEENDNKKVDVKTDDRAKMSVAAKMSLFKELEKSTAPDSSALLKPRSGSSFHERRTRRGNDHCFLTQPITCEEMVAIRLQVSGTRGARKPESITGSLPCFNEGMVLFSAYVFFPPPDILLIQRPEQIYMSRCLIMATESSVSAATKSSASCH